MVNGVSSASFSFSYAAVSVLRVNITASPLTSAHAAGPTAGTPEATSPTAVTGTAPDSVTLSPAALAAGQTEQAGASSASGESGGATPTASASASPAPSSSAQRIAALIKALDTNQDGALSQDEFVQGAKSLLRGGRGHHHRAERHGDDGDEGGGRSERSRGRSEHGHGMEKRLERAFGVIDSDGNGSLTPDELVAVLDRATAKSASAPSTDAGASAPESTAAAAAPATPVAPATPAAPAPADAAPTVNGSFSVTSVTFVSIAVQRYQSIGQLAH